MAGSIGKVYDYGFRIYDSRIAKFLSVDPLTKEYPHWTPYQFAGNMPIMYIDLDGLEPAFNPDNPANQDERDPTSTIAKVYDLSGGDQSFEKNFQQYLKGTYDGTGTITNLTNKKGYTSDSKEHADRDKSLGK